MIICHWMTKWGLLDDREECYMPHYAWSGRATLPPREWSLSSAGLDNVCNYNAQFMYKGNAKGDYHKNLQKLTYQLLLKNRMISTFKTVFHRHPVTESVRPKLILQFDGAHYHMVCLASHVYKLTVAECITFIKNHCLKGRQRSGRTGANKTPLVAPIKSLGTVDEPFKRHDGSQQWLYLEDIEGAGTAAPKGPYAQELQKFIAAQLATELAHLNDTEAEEFLAQNGADGSVVLLTIPNLSILACIELLWAQAKRPGKVGWHKNRKLFDGDGNIWDCLQAGFESLTHSQCEALIRHEVKQMDTLVESMTGRIFTEGSDRSDYGRNLGFMETFDNLPGVLAFKAAIASRSEKDILHALVKCKPCKMPEVYCDGPADFEVPIDPQLDDDSESDPSVDSDDE